MDWHFGMWRSAAFFAFAACDAACVALLYVAMLVAPRFISGGEVALIMLLEGILGPVWVFLRFGDVPSVWTIAGGALLLATLIGHEIAGMGAASPAHGEKAYGGARTPTTSATDLAETPEALALDAADHADEVPYSRVPGPANADAAHAGEAKRPQSMYGTLMHGMTELWRRGMGERA